MIYLSDFIQSPRASVWISSEIKKGGMDQCWPQQLGYYLQYGQNFNVSLISASIERVRGQKYEIKKKININGTTLTAAQDCHWHKLFIMQSLQCYDISWKMYWYCIGNIEWNIFCKINPTASSLKWQLYYSYTLCLSRC